MGRYQRWMLKGSGNALFYFFYWKETVFFFNYIKNHTI